MDRLEVTDAPVEQKAVNGKGRKTDIIRKNNREVSANGQAIKFGIFRHIGC